MQFSSIPLVLAYAPLYVFCSALALSCLFIGARLIRIANQYGKLRREEDFVRFQRVAGGGAMMSLTLVGCIGISIGVFYSVQHSVHF